jgi:hypothetical protein
MGADMQDPNQTNNATGHRQRDAASLKILGSFFTILSILVWIGTFWTLDNRRAVVVNLCCGGVLFAVGLGMLLVARKHANSEPFEE